MIRYLLLAAAAAEAAVVEYVWEARFVFLAPDGVEKMIGTINGEYPGPEIRVKKGDTVKVQVTNDLANTGLTLHWHGILHAGWFDGVASGTQCPIGEKETFTYEFEANEAGTYWWHAHTSTLRAPSLIGPLIVEDDMPEPFEYDEELTVLLTDHWNQKDDRTLVEGLRQQQFKWVGDPQTLLLNGRGCALSNWTACQEAGVEPAYLDVEPGKTYRLRLINGGAMQFMTATVEGHNVTVVEMDGRYVEPFQVRDVDVNTGNRVSVLLEAKGQTSGSYWVHVQTKFRDTLIHGYAVLRYSNDTTLPDSDPPTEASYPEADVYSDAAYVGAASDHYVDFYNGIVAHPDAAATDPCPDTDDRFFVVTNSQERMDRFGLVSYTPYTFESGGAAYWNGSANVDPLFAETYGFYGNVEVDGSSAADGYLKWPVHVTVDADDLPSATGTAADLPATPIQLSLYYGLDPQYPAMFSLDLGAVVTVVVQNARTLNGKLEQHPWHLHGHAFWVLAHGVGLWNVSPSLAFFREFICLILPPRGRRLTARTSTPSIRRRWTSSRCCRGPGRRSASWPTAPAPTASTATSPGTSRWATPSTSRPVRRTRSSRLLPTFPSAAL